MSGAVRIIGAESLCTAGRGTEALWRAAAEVRPGLRPASLGDERLADARAASIPAPRPADAELASTWLHEVAASALRQAGSRIGRDRPRTALIGGSTLGGMAGFEHDHRSWWDPGGSSGPGLLRRRLPLDRKLYSGPSAHVGRELRADAGAWTINTACSSSANALGLARQWLDRGRIDVAVVCGFDAISPFVYAGFSSLGIVDPHPTRPFCGDRRGLNLGEAAVALVLVRAGDAAPEGRDVDVIGYGSSCDAHRLARPDLEGGGLARAIQVALEDAGVTPGDIGMISAHGTGTEFNDQMEARAFTRVFGRGSCPPIHCAKPITGHTLGAAGAIDVLLTMEMLTRRQVPPTYGPSPLDEALPVVPSRTPRELPGGCVALSTSSGFGGSNAALLLRVPGAA